MKPDVSLRPAREEDHEFFYQVFKSVRGPQFAGVPFTPEQLEGLLRMQYAARTGSYESSFPDSQNSVVLCGGEPVGQLWVYRTNEEHRIVDIALLPERCGIGIGSALMRDLIAAADVAGVPLRCAVASGNEGSLRFHERHGFAIIERDEAYIRLEHRRDS